MRFPKTHLATSVVNRILNLADEYEPQTPPAEAQPEIPETSMQSTILDEQLATGAPALPGIDQAPDPGGTISGRPLLDTLVNPDGR